MSVSLSPSNRLLNDANRYLKTRAGFDVRHVLGVPIQVVPDRFAVKSRETPSVESTLPVRTNV